MPRRCAGITCLTAADSRNARNTHIYRTRQGEKEVQLDNGTWVMVADGEKYLLLRNIGDRDFMHLEVVEHDDQQNAPARELSTDRAGRQYDATQRQAEGTVEAFGRSAMEETDWHRVAKERFAEDAAEKLGQWAASGRFRDIVVVADPRSLGALRNAYDHRLKPLIVAEIDKDLTNLPLEKIEASIKAFDAS